MDSRDKISGQLVVIVLHYRGIDDTVACLESIYEDRDVPARVLLVDNGSGDNVASLVRARFADVALLELPENRGWAGGNNAGIAWAMRDGAEFVCLLNNDTLVPPGTFGALLRISREAYPCLLEPAIDYIDPAEGAQIDPSLWDGHVPLRAGGSLYELDFAYGACLVIPVSVFRIIGLFDERFFLQLEETDFYYRAMRRGVRSLCDVGVRIRHAESRSFGERVTPDKTYYSMRNSLLLAAKNLARPRIAMGVLKRAYWVTALRAVPGSEPSLWRTLRWFVSRHEHARAARAGVHDFLFRRFGVRRSTIST
jgi:GT2 family glycosyltransferase